MFLPSIFNADTLSHYPSFLPRSKWKSIPVCIVFNCFLILFTFRKTTTSVMTWNDVE